MALNPLRTKFEITIHIDETPYNVVVKAVNKDIQAKLSANLKENASKYEELDSKKYELKELNSLKQVEEQILKEGNVVEKSRVWFSHRDLISKISNLEKELRILEKNARNIHETVEEHYKELFNLCVAGEDKAKLELCINENGLSYETLYLHINELVRVAQEKK